MATDEQNPYQAPQAAQPAASSTYQLAARFLLEAREHGYTYALCFRWSARGYAVLAVAFAVLMILLYQFDGATPFAVALGFLAGVFYRDLCWVAAIRKTWPFHAAVYDWDKVQRVADHGTLG